MSYIKHKQIKVRGDEIRSTSNKTRTMQKQTLLQNNSEACGCV